MALLHDQTPETGWRPLTGPPGDPLACATAIGALIDEYAAVNATTLTGFNIRILSWHAGQMYAFAADYESARRRLLGALDPEEPDTPDFPWNAYVHATVAFLDNDLEELRRQRALIATSPTQGNLEVVDRLIAGINTPYATAYTGR